MGIFGKSTGGGSGDGNKWTHNQNNKHKGEKAGNPQSDQPQHGKKPPPPPRRRGK